MDGCFAAVFEVGGGFRRVWARWLPARGKIRRSALPDRHTCGYAEAET